MWFPLSLRFSPRALVIARALRPTLFAWLLGISAPCAYAQSPLPAIPAATLARQLQVGDLVFIRVSALPFREVAATTGSWTNHVGIVVATDGLEPVIAESTFPLSKRGGLARFLARSEDGRVEVSRLNAPLTLTQRSGLMRAAQRRTGVFYDTGFDLHSRRQFCSRFVHEVVQEATGIEVGKVETFGALLAHNPDPRLGFWRVWYFGRIPWQRETITPASIINNTRLHVVFDGYARL